MPWITEEEKKEVMDRWVLLIGGPRSIVGVGVVAVG